MTSVLEAVRGIVHPGRIVELPGELTEDAKAAAMMTKGRTRPGKVELPNFPDKLSSMRIYQMPGGGEIRLESFFG